MGTFLIIFAYIFVICEALWYFTCTEHKKIPLIIVLAILVISLIPGATIIFAIGNLFVIGILYDAKYIILKDNWFNRVFLGYHNE